MKNKIGVVGASGRTGALIVELLRNHPLYALGAAIVSSRSSRIGVPCFDSNSSVKYSDRLEDLRGCSGVIDFSSPDISVAVAKVCAESGVPLLLATTGLSADCIRDVQGLTTQIPLLLAANTSLGAAVLAVAAQQVQRMLGAAFDVEVLEIHHRMKKDAPSGTAKSLATLLASPIINPTKQVVYGRQGLRRSEEIGVASLRGGDVAGDHTVYFLGESERLELTHKVNDRVVFARGALVFYELLSTRAAGLYTVLDLLG